MNPKRFQVIVTGSGFGGSIMAMIAHRLGFTTLLVERGRHPRFAIGESTTPLTNLLLEQIANDYDLFCLRPLCKWGTWQAHTPHLACGLKRGFTFYKHQLDQPFAPDPERRRQLMVGASPREDIADTHWYRPDFDHYLVQQAQVLGVTYWDETQLTRVTESPDGIHLSGTQNGEPLELAGDFLIDASGPRGFLHRALGLPERPFNTFPATQALYSHFTGVGPLPASFHAGDLAPPYPPEQAAVHHLFPGGWIWVLKFNNGITSAGVAATNAFANALDFRSGESAWQRLLQRLPSLAEIFASARAVVPFFHQPRIAFQSEVITGARWALLPSAVGVIDPLLSTGFPLTLLGVGRLAQVLVKHWQQPSFPPALVEYAELTRLELNTTAKLVATLYRTMDRFELFQDLSLLYFAAASFSETVRRLGKPHLADGFLLCRNPVFAKQLDRFCEAASRPFSAQEAAELGQTIRTAIEPFDVAGLTDRSRHPWYPANVSDVLGGAAKVDASGKDMTEMLRKCGL